jgi:phage baseplate assembly protein W
MEYLALPLELRDGYLKRAESLNDSILFSIGVLLSTRLGMMDFLPDFGCDIWQFEYSDLYAANKADIRASLRNAIEAFEKRLYNTSVSFAGVDDTSPHVLGMTVRVSGNYREDGEEKKFEGKYLLG